MSLALHFDNSSTELRTRLSTSVKPFVRLREDLRRDLRTGFTNEHEKKKKLVKIRAIRGQNNSRNSCNSWQKI